MRTSFFYLVLLLKRTGIALLLFTICRALFFGRNSSLFSNVHLTDFLHGVRFDLSAIAWLFLPYAFFELIPFSFRKAGRYRSMQRFLFNIPLVISLILNLIDVEFYSFTLKRMTADMLSFVATGDDTLRLLPQFFHDYWFTVIIFIGLCWFADFLFRNTEPLQFPEKHNYFFQFATFVIGASLIIVATRGGFQLRPISIIHASAHSAPQNTAVVLNTPFTFLKSIGKDFLKPKHYFEEPELSHIFNPKLVITNESEFKPRNVVLIILESFSREYIGGYGHTPTYTPFLDSLMGHSLIFKHFYANGKRSIEALPAIFSGIPALMNTPYVSSPYAGNKIGSLAKTLKKKGYNSAFFHGGNNGTMGFNAFTTMAGIEAYYGRSEYPDQNDFDGNWGIYDEPFFQFFAEKLDGFESPFFATFFSLSSHHPYSIPSQYTNRFPKGELEIHETIGYTDMALGQFFNRIKEASWYNNSIFLITADHTAQSIAPEYKTNVGMYALPFIVFDPSTNVQDFNTNTSQQADIPAIVLDLLNYSGTVLSFGKNPLQEGDKSFCVNYNNGIYQFISKGYCLRFDGSASIGLYHLTKDPLLSVNLLEEEPFIKQTMERTLKAIIQSYNDRLINNRWQLNE